jgi:hypothetical protein
MELVASYKVSYLITKAKKLHTISESLIMLAGIKIMELLHDRKYANELKIHACIK